MQPNVIAVARPLQIQDPRSDDCSRRVVGSGVRRGFRPWRPCRAGRGLPRWGVRFRGWLLIFWGLAAAASWQPIAADVRFNTDVRPILAEHCLHCHGPDEGHREADLRLDVQESATESVIVPGHPEHSALIERITTTDADLQMPPPSAKKPLTDREVEMLRRWIAEGARFEGHWAFEPIRAPEIPKTQAPAATEIDRFVLSRLEARGLTMSPAVSRQQLIRRATLDLIGLPPSWDEVQAFVHDEAPDAFARVIDRLLASPRYGERWGRHWLDLARYADTHGGSAIGFTKFPFSYTYRDYVIRAFNADLPYDRFVTEQLAADQLGLDDNDPRLAALGFLTVGMQFRSRHDVIDDQIDVTSRGLLGLTVACARCHDHKYDPIPTTDYYALYATFASSASPDLPPFVGQPADTPEYRQYETELRQRQTIHDDMARDQTEVMRSRLRMQAGLYLRELARGTPEQDLSAAFLSYRTDDVRPLVLNRWRDYLAAMPADDPVFGPWVTLSGIDPEGFPAKALERIAAWKQEIGDPAQYAAMHDLAAQAPKWNPRVLEALAAKAPQSLTDVADTYGALFATVHREWLTALSDASLEAAVDGEIIPDQDPRHAAINSPIDSQLRRHLYEPGTPTAMSQQTAMTLLNRTVRDSLGGRQGAIDGLQLTPGSPPRAMVLHEHVPDRPFHVFRRGNPLDRGAFVQPHFLTVLSPAGDTPAVFPDGQRRLALAHSLTAPENPLLRRVIVNWVWQQHFGRGLVRTPDDFGTRSQPPTHPRLLDYLAVRFAEDGWSLKQLHRRMMLTDVYRQAAIEQPASRVTDPDNELLWRMPRRRLDMEAMRDSLLAVSGELDVSETSGRPFEFLSDPIVPRRSIYGFVNRDIIHSLASTFDAANPTSCTARRPETTVPQQTLFALNSKFIQDRAAAFAGQVSDIPDPAARIAWLYRRAWGRDPEPAETAAALEFVSGTSDTDPWPQLAHVLLAANEFVFVD